MKSSTCLFMVCPNSLTTALKLKRESAQFYTSLQIITSICILPPKLILRQIIAYILKTRQTNITVLKFPFCLLLYFLIDLVILCTSWMAWYLWYHTMDDVIWTSDMKKINIMIAWCVVVYYFLENLNCQSNVVLLTLLVTS